jgi:hypothetical protein
MEVLKELFVNLEEEALAFLAGMWTNSSHQTGGISSTLQLLYTTRPRS